MKSNIKPNKGMIFAGCSFTWGQGLHYYRNTDTIKEPLPQQFDSKLLTTSHYDFIKKLRYPRLVADHFNTTEFVRKDNGGDNETIIDWFDSILFNNQQQPRYFHDYYYMPSEFSHLFFQFTVWSRSNATFTRKELFNDERDEIISTPIKSLYDDPKYFSSFMKYLEKNKMTLDEFLLTRKLLTINNVKQWLKKVESYGIKTYVLNWENEITDIILKDEWLQKRFITFSYKNKTFNDMQSLMEHNNSELTIMYDTDNFVEGPQDHHPSKQCHRVVADSIINRLEQDGHERN